MEKNDCLRLKPYEYVKIQLKLTPNITKQELLKKLNDGLIYNTEEVLSPVNADNFARAIKWVKKFDNIQKIKEAIRYVD